ncbi:hypothetical protein GCM10027290_18400 [Micromonospora sonneratiae]|uniref:Uncharacterized protein n=1 Tax=Micromonospora sonneratiae TaxID=1184706 RepID=A0ABW3YAI3_9ACTN
MAVVVEIPCRLRVDRESLAQSADEVVAAFSSALGRAMATAEAELLIPRGATPLAHQPVFRWLGVLQGVPTEHRRALEDRLRAAVSRAAAASKVRADAAVAVDTVAPLTDAPAELVDRSKLRPLMGTYGVPSYDGGGRTRDVPVRASRPPAPPSVGYEWRLLTGSLTAAEKLEIVRVAQLRFGPLDRSTPRGLIFRERVGGANQFTVAIFEATPIFFSFSAFGTLEYQRSASDFTTAPTEPPPGPATAEFRAVTDRAGLIAVVAEFMDPPIRRQIQAAEPRREGTRVSEHDLQLDRAVAAHVERLTDRQLASLRGQSPAGVVIVQRGSAFVMLIVTAAQAGSLRWSGIARLLPVTNEVTRAGDDGGRGGDGGGARGSGAGAGGDGGEAGSGDRGGSGGSGGGGEGRGSGTGTGSGGGAPQRGGFVFDPTNTLPTSDDPNASRFPVIHRTGAGLQCQSMNGEPEVAELGQAAAEIRRRIDDLAFRLQIAPCNFAANFCILAARALRQRAADISTYITTTERAGFTQPVPEATGPLGPLTFQPVASPAIQFLRHLAGVVPRLHALAMLTLRTYESPEHWPKVKGGWIDSPASWNLHFLHEFTPAMNDAVGEIFVSGCQAMLLQLLLASKQGIEARITNFNRYAPIFERLMVSQLSDYAELQGLRDRLRWHERATWVHGATTTVGGDAAATVAVANPATAWFAAARSLSAAFLADERTVSAGTVGEIVTADGVTKIRDSRGMLWSEADIEQALVLQRAESEGIDPLVKQIADIPDVLSRFRRDRNAIRNELWRVLQEMRSNNTEMLGKARASARFAFKASQISEHIPTATIPGTSYPLQGIHLQVHEQLGEFFGGNVCYGLGIDRLFSAELGREALTSVGLTIGIVALSVLCPPAGFLVGVAVAGVEVAHAHERERLFESMLDPELVLTRAEVEVGLFAAYLGLALSLLPEAGTAVGAAVRGGRTAVRTGLQAGLRAGLRAGGRSARRYVVRRVTRQVLEAAQRDLLTEFVTQVTTALVMEKVVQKVLEPLLAHIEREAMIRGSVGGPDGARFVLAALRRDDADTSGGVR